MDRLQSEKRSNGGKCSTTTFIWRGNTRTIVHFTRVESRFLQVWGHIVFKVPKRDKHSKMVEKMQIIFAQILNDIFYRKNEHWMVDTKQSTLVCYKYKLLDLITLFNTALHRGYLTCLRYWSPLVTFLIILLSMFKHQTLITTRILIVFTKKY